MYKDRSKNYHTDASFPERRRQIIEHEIFN